MMRPSAGLQGTQDLSGGHVNQPSGPEETWLDKMMHSCALGFTDLTLGDRSQGNSSRGIVE